ncbi:putative quinol monooxygenase [Calidifontibacter terrae]
MILINVRMPIREDKLAQWHDLSAAYAAAVNGEEGCLFFEFAQSVQEPNTYVCIEGYVDAAAGEVHMQQQHVADFFSAMPDIVSARPEIIYTDAKSVDGFGPMGEIQPRG